MASFYEVLTAAVKDFTENGYDSQERLQYWLAQIRIAAVASLAPEAQMQQLVRSVLTRDYKRLIENAGILKHHPGIERFTLDRVKPQLRAELDRRILASANLIKLNRQAAIEKTLQRFSGWSTSIPAGGSRVVGKLQVKEDLKKPLRSLSFDDRRVAIDQGHKFLSSLNDILATSGGAIAGVWHSHVGQPGYDARINHAERNKKTYLIRDSWAHKAGLVKPDANGYTDAMDQPGEKVFCRCFYGYVYALRDLPAEMLTEKGRTAMAEVAAKRKALGI